MIVEARAQFLHRMRTGVPYGPGVPSTIPSHQAVVLPLKLRWPARFDGVALVIGSMAPDFPYVLEGSGVDLHSHAWHALLWYAVPVTFAVSRVVRWAAPAVAAHLPNAGPLALRDYGVLGTVRHPVSVTAVSSVVGAFSHVAWDSVTHPFVVAVHPFLGGSVPGLPRWYEIRQVSDLVGTLAVLAMALVIGRRRLLVTWHGPPPTVPRRPILFWGVALVVTAALLVLAAVLPGNDAGQHVVGTRTLACAALALLAAAAAVAIPVRRAIA